MNFPQTAEGVKDEILISAEKSVGIGDLRLRQFIKILEKVDEELIVEAIIQILEDYENDFIKQEYCGKILEEVQPNSNRDLESLLKRMLKNWNKSVEQVPIWIRKNYGFDVMREVFDTVEKSGLSEIELDKLGTMRWWITNKEGEANKK